MQREADILKQLDHPNIVRLYETFDDGSAFKIVTELIEGVTLDKFIQSHHYAQERKEDWVLD